MTKGAHPRTTPERGVGDPQQCRKEIGAWISLACPVRRALLRLIEPRSVSSGECGEQLPGQSFPASPAYRGQVRGLR
ncbi:MAG TPA: hypothetical protein VG754_08615 [Verrucomicrobiae bacterium]|nr:hypothetical protein [Verrucomicrobiae bacterium]